jgi:purine-binding chemotaxis protein CheW
VVTASNQLISSNLDSENTNKYLSFIVGEETYAISILKVKEILEYEGVTPVPKMPSFLRGAINLRGRVVPIVDLATLLTNTQTEISRKTCIIIVELKLDDGSMDVGLMIDAVSQVQDIEPENIESAPSFGGRINTDYISGMGKTEKSFVILINVDNILSVEDMVKITTASEDVAEDTEE